MASISEEESSEGHRIRLPWHDGLLAVSLLITVAGSTSILADHLQKLTEGPEPKPGSNLGWTGVSNALPKDSNVRCSAQLTQSITPN